MFKKIHRQLERKREGRVPLKFRFDVQIVQITNLPPAVNKCRVVWARGPKVQMTRVETAAKGNNWQVMHLMFQICAVSCIWVEHEIDLMDRYVLLERYLSSNLDLTWRW